MSAIELLLEQIESQHVLNFMLNHWKQARGSSLKPPLKADIDLFALGPAGLLPHIWLVEPDERDGYHLRLVGGEIRNNFIDNPLHKNFIDLLGPKNGKQMSEAVDEVLTTPGIHYSEGPVLRPDMQSYFGRRIMLPLRTSSSECDLMLGVFVKDDLKISSRQIDTTEYLFTTKMFASVSDLDATFASRQATSDHPSLDCINTDESSDGKAADAAH